MEKIKGNIFVQNMANTIEDMNKNRLLKYRPLFLVRNPAEVIVSHIKLDRFITGEDLCFEHQVKIYDWLQEQTKEDPLVIDGNELIKDPKSMLTRLCNKLNLPFTDEMLLWSAGPKSIDGAWAPAWYNAVHQSTGFGQPSSTKLTRNDVPSEFLALYDEVLPYYHKLVSHSIRD